MSNGDRIPNPYLVGTSGPSVVLPARVRHVLMAELGRHLSSLRVRARGVDQEVAYALLALASAAHSYVPPAEQVRDKSAEQAAVSTWVDVAEAARVLKVGDRAVRFAIARGRLPASKVGNSWQINRTDVEQYKAARAA